MSRFVLCPPRSVSGTCPWSAGSLRWCRWWSACSAGPRATTPGTSSSPSSPPTPCCPSPSSGPSSPGRAPPPCTCCWTSTVTTRTAPSCERWARRRLSLGLSLRVLRSQCLHLTCAGVVQGPAVPGHEHSRVLHSLPVRPHPETVLPGDQALYRGTRPAGEREPQTGAKTFIPAGHMVSCTKRWNNNNNCCWINSIALRLRPSGASGNVHPAPIYRPGDDCRHGPH